MRNVNSRSYTRAIFSVLKAVEGGLSFANTKEMLEANGVQNVRRDHTIYVGHYGFSVPKKYERRTARLLWGR